MGSFNQVRPRRTATRLTSLLLVSLFTVTATATGASANGEGVYPPVPGWESGDLTCTPEKPAPGSTLTCLLEGAEEYESLGAYMYIERVLVDDAESYEYESDSIQEEDFEVEIDSEGKATFTLEISPEAREGDQLGVSVGYWDEDACFAIDDQTDETVAGPGTLDFGDDGFTIDGEFFDWNDYTIECDGFNAYFTSTIGATSTGGEAPKPEGEAPKPGGEAPKPVKGTPTTGSTTGTVATPAASPTAVTAAAGLPRTGAGVALLSLGGLLSLGAGGMLLRGDDVVSRLRRKG